MYWNEHNVRLMIAIFFAVFLVFLALVSVTVIVPEYRGYFYPSLVVAFFSGAIGFFLFYYRGSLSN